MLVLFFFGVIIFNIAFFAITSIAYYCFKTRWAAPEKDEMTMSTTLHTELVQVDSITSAVKSGNSENT